MQINRFYTTWTADNNYQYKLYIIPSHGYIDAIDTITYGYVDIELPGSFVLQDMQLETELGDIPAGLVAQTLQLECNIAALQGTTALNDLRTALLRGTTDYLYPIKASGAFQQTNVFDCFNTFYLMCDNGTGTFAPVFIGCQKFAAENELTITPLKNVVPYKIELFDIMRCIGEMIAPSFWAFQLKAEDVSVDYGGGYSANEKTEYKKLRCGTTYATTIGFGRTGAIDLTLDSYYYNVTTFERFQSKVNEMYAGHLRALIPNYSNTVSVPEPFKKAWTFYKNRLDFADTLTAVPKLGYVSDIVNANTGNVDGGVHVDKNAFGAYTNFHEIVKLLAEQSLEIYRLAYSYSSVYGWFGATYTSDYCLPATKAGDTLNGTLFDTSNITSDVKIKLLQETVSNATSNVKTITGDSDTQDFPYGKQGTSGDNGKDIEVIFHNLTLATNRKNDEILGGQIVPGATQVDAIDNTTYYVRNGIAAGQLAYNDNGTIRKVDTQCRVSWNYDYSEPEITTLEGKFVGRNSAIIKEQQEAGLPLTLSTAIVTVLGDPKQAVAEFDTLVDYAKYTDVGRECRLDLNSLNPLLVSIYGSNTAKAVITKHSQNIKTGVVSLTIRVHGL